MKNKTSAILKSLGVTAGLNLVLLAVLLLFPPLIGEDLGQALLFCAITLILTAGVCLYGVIGADRRSTLWACLGISAAAHLVLSAAVAFIGGNRLSDEWPGGTGDNLVSLLVLLMSLSAWYAGIFAVTAVRSYRLGYALREDRRQIRRAKKGYSKEWQILPPPKGRFVAALRGFLWVLWLHLATGLVYFGLTHLGLADTILSYAAFPVLWCLMAAAYGLSKTAAAYQNRHRMAFSLSASLSHIALFLLSTYLIGLRYTPDIRHRFILHLDGMLNRPFACPEQLLAIGIFLSGWIAIAVFGVGHGRRRSG